MGIGNLVNRARSYAGSPQGKRLIGRAGGAARQRGGRNRGAGRRSGTNGVMGMAQRFLGRGSGGPGAGRTTPRR